MSYYPAGMTRSRFGNTCSHRHLSTRELRRLASRGKPDPKVMVDARITKRLWQEAHNEDNHDRS